MQIDFNQIVSGFAKSQRLAIQNQDYVAALKAEDMAETEPEPEVFGWQEEPKGPGLMELERAIYNARFFGGVA